LEALASGLPVVGLKAEGVRDLVEHGQRGLLLDLSDLDPSTSGVDPVKLLARGSSSFVKAASLYRSLLLDLVVNEDRRAAFASNAVSFAQTQSWDRAMHSLLEGYTEAAAFSHHNRAAKLELALSRNSSMSSIATASTATSEEESTTVAYMPWDLGLTIA
jgi:hypothetical protein